MPHFVEGSFYVKEQGYAAARNTSGDGGILRHLKKGMKRRAFFWNPTCVGVIIQMRL